MRGLHDAIDASHRGPAMQLSQVFHEKAEDARRAREEVKQPLKTARGGHWRGAAKRSLFKLLNLSISVKKAAEGEKPSANAHEVPVERTWAHSKDWLGEALELIGVPIVHPRPSEPTGRITDAQSVPDVLWRSVEPDRSEEHTSELQSR